MRKRLKARGTELKHERADQAPEGTGLRFEQPGGGGCRYGWTEGLQ